MNEAKPTNKNRKLIIAAIIVILAGIYWFGARPHFAKTSCSREAEDYATETYYDGTTHKSIEKYEAQYNVCLNRKGF
jgi:hypothetical protein